MIGLLCFVPAELASPFKLKSRLEAEEAVLRHQLIVLRPLVPRADVSMVSINSDGRYDCPT
jgi:hypothetical protein